MLRRLRNESWRYITYSLVHEDKEHILANLLLLVCLGLVLEMVHGCWRVGLIFFSGVLAGSLAAYCFESQYGLCFFHYSHRLSKCFITPSNLRVIVGRADRVQRGGVQHHCGSPRHSHPQLEGGHHADHHQVAARPDPPAQLQSRVRARQDRGSVHAIDGKGVRALELLAVSLLIVGDVSLAVYKRYSNTHSHNNTSYVAHVTGAMVGLMVGILVLRNRYVEPWEKNLKVQG